MQKIKKLNYFIYFIICSFSMTMLTFAEDCSSVMGGDVNTKTSATYFLQQIFNIFKFGVPLLCIVLITMDFIKAVGDHDADALKKSSKKAIIRVILSLVLFMLPTLLNFIFPLFGWNGTCGIS